MADRLRCPTACKPTAQVRKRNDGFADPRSLTQQAKLRQRCFLPKCPITLNSCVASKSFWIPREYFRLLVSLLERLPRMVRWSYTRSSAALDFRINRSALAPVCISETGANALRLMFRIQPRAEALRKSLPHALRKTSERATRTRSSR